MLTCIGLLRETIKLSDHKISVTLTKILRLTLTCFASVKVKSVLIQAMYHMVCTYIMNGPKFSCLLMNLVSSIYLITLKLVKIIQILKCTNTEQKRYSAYTWDIS